MTRGAMFTEEGDACVQEKKLREMALLEVALEWRSLMSLKESVS